MGCSQSKESVLLGLKDEIQLLQKKKSQIILEVDGLKDSNKFYSMSEEEKAITLRKLSTELANLKIESERLENLGSQVSGLSSKIQDFDSDLADKSEQVKILTETCEKRKNEYLAQLEENNKINNETSDLSFEHSKKSKHAHKYSFAHQENENLQEKIKDLEDSLKRLQETEDLIAENERKIVESEERISELRPLIQEQNEKHSALLKIQNEIQTLRHVLISASLSSNERKFKSELQTTLSICHHKSEKMHQKLESLNSINIDDLKSQKETQTLILQTLKSDLKNMMTQANQDFIELCKLESKKNSIESHSNIKVNDLETAYQLACRKIQKKENEKISLEKELKEYQEILKELDF